ncbi:hypothetical protein [Streptomyces sp. SAS_276]|uniref:hypothetical protein n=1 Tax=Streptomyces sp. SAS_276 TaxID=3412745 RepID=UPI00403C8D1C
MAHTLEELVNKQHTADAAHARVKELRDAYGPGAKDDGWTAEQTATYTAAWNVWREHAQEVQAAVTAHAKDEGTSRYEVESAVKKKARHPEPETAAA